MGTLREILRLFFYGVFFGVLMLIPASSYSQLRIMPLGDSLTAGGYNWNGQYHIDGGYRQRLAELLEAKNLNFDFVGSLSDGPMTMKHRNHEGHSGYRIEELTAVCEEPIKKFLPDVILLLIGTNDIVQNYDLSNAPTRFKILLEKILQVAPQAQIYISSVIPTNSNKWNLEIKNYNSEIQKIILEKKNAQLHWVDMFYAMSWGLADFTDGVHPTASAYARMAEVWFGALF